METAGKDAFFQTRMMSVTPMAPLPMEMEAAGGGDAEMDDDGSDASEDSGIDSTSQDAAPRHKVHVWHLCQVNSVC